ncbi:uncharacterized protein LOC142356673, partial [Convolutriloba macropyga]|uniref:uncharacterized protein LOC142356673 n=1 Tax=Convolutriloba macropyga TaxID=536237 RepID=UPI003F5203C6
RKKDIPINFDDSKCVEELEKGSSDKEIQFTDAILCYHNLYRDGADLEKLEWNTHLAKFAADWAAELKDNNECMMKHSEHDARKNLGRGVESISGENLYTASSSSSIKEKHLVKHAKQAVHAWFREIKNYQFPGESAGYDDCEMKEVTGHFTQ